MGVQMGHFIKDLLPDPTSYFEAEGLKLSSKGKWRTTSCRFHGGSDSMRVNLQSGGWCCMACDAKGGDLLSYQMQAHGQDFIEAAKALGAWQEDGKGPLPQKPTPLSARQALQVLAMEANLAAVAAANVAHGTVLSAPDLARLLQASARITRLVEVFQ